MKFCERCFKRLSAEWAKKVNFDPRYTLDVKRMNFPCQIPIYETDCASGDQMVRIWNCETEKFDIYGLKEYNDKKARGEIG